MSDNIVQNMYSNQGTINCTKQLHLVGNSVNYILMHGTMNIKLNAYFHFGRIRACTKLLWNACDMFMYGYPDGGFSVLSPQL
jgi:hypothetical protein